MKMHVTALRPGDRLAADAYNPFGLLILSAGAVLDDNDINRLLLHRIEYVDIEPRLPETPGQASTDSSQAATAVARAPNPFTRTFNAAVHDVRNIFEHIRTTGEISVQVLETTAELLLDELRHERDLVRVLLTSVSHDQYTYRHSVQVGSICYYIAKWHGYAEPDCVRIGTAGLLHDIGKARIPESILNKPGALTDEEFAFVRRHVEFGYELIRRSFKDEWYALGALQHHERLDGSGYPYGLKGDDIHPVGRIVAVADVYSAMISERSYRQKKHLLEVLREIYQMSFSQLDPHIVQTFLRQMMPSFIGKAVRLSDGRVARIAMVYEHDWFGPLVHVEGEFIDLSREKHLRIEEFAV